MNSIFVKYGADGKELTKSLLEHMSIGLGVHAGMRIGIKPNLVVAKPSASGATTDPQVVAGIIEYLRDHGCRHITIMESSWLGDSTKRAWQACGYTQLAKRYQVPLIDLKTDATRLLSTTKYQLRVCATCLDTDYLINVPVLKAHCQTKLTCSLKNMKGCIPDQEKRNYHALGLHGPIAHLNSALKQHLVVVDALIGDLTYEEGGTPVQMNRVLAGTDPVAMDAYCASLLGYDPEDVPYIGMAAGLGVGQMDYTVKTLNQGKEARLISAPIIDRFRQFIDEKQACSACLGSLLHALQRLSDQGIAIAKPIRIGQGFRGKTEDGLGIGSCTGCFDTSISGCPPSARQILAHLNCQNDRS